MHYYEIWVRSGQYRGHEALTYSSATALQIGQLVQVPLRNQTILGFVNASVMQPSFTTKAVTASLPYKPLPPRSIDLANWLANYYPSPIGVLTQQFLPRELPLKRLNELLKDQAATTPDTIHLPPLTNQQQAALGQITDPGSYVLHGSTGSGKTRLYIELAQRAFQAGQSVLILSPEITLTSQLARIFEETFQQQVIILHSRLTDAERQRAWLTILQTTEPRIIIGPRSALFSPVANLGLIVIDEAHEPAYKQEQAPYYQTTRVAAQLASIHTATLVLGSATPSINDYFIAAAKNRPIIRLNELATRSTALHKTHIVDLRDRSLFSRAPHISNVLIEAIQGSLERNEQSLLYLNRRGTARLTLCEHCGWQSLCPHCDLPLTYHADLHQLLCHVCGYRTPLPVSCPVCHNPSIVLKSIGTKAIVQEISTVFPEARVIRFDTDNQKADRFEQQYEIVQSGGVDILVGTQILAKGLDLPKLSTLGVIAADSSLALPDYTAQERTYQLLNQVLGRVGRGHVDSQAIIQTYSPDSLVLQDALNDNWTDFYERELTERKKYFFPPYCYLLKLTCRRKSDSAAEKAALNLAGQLKRPSIRIEGPAPAMHQKVDGAYEWQITIKAIRRPVLLEIIKALPTSGWRYDIDPQTLL
jgi:primosomal protein N' (replication factor Y)